eukprot:TRINITY_DN1477_c0_g1_i2.p2 TRINITY_DN1477_c0_g1~~TRINITY_DN1477_c0_g1_i2.p2  ORF type:complete len:286 (+),score=72.98 TRINITY_DN1477_c0_g1_i2:119-976(+)
MEHGYDFYKPDMQCEFPTVDGQLSIGCFLRSLDSCYNTLMDRLRGSGEGASAETAGDFFLFHSPYNKLVQKAFARLLFNDCRRAAAGGEAMPGAVAECGVSSEELAAVLGADAAESYTSKDVEKVTLALSARLYEAKVQPTTLLAKQLGNSYTASLYTSVLSLIAQRTDAELAGKRLVLFSYGSGSCSSMFCVRVAGPVGAIRNATAVVQRLGLRKGVSAGDFVSAMELRQQRYNQRDFVPTDSIEALFPGTFYLAGVDSQFRRTYKRKDRRTGSTHLPEMCTAV